MHIRYVLMNLKLKIELIEKIDRKNKRDKGSGMLNLKVKKGGC